MPTAAFRPTSAAAAAILGQSSAADTIVLELKEMVFSFTVLMERHRTGSPTDPTLTHAVLHKAAQRLQRLSELMGVPLESSTDVAQHYAELRDAHKRILELEAALAARSPELAVSATLRQLADRVSAWWSSYGVGSVDELWFTREGALGFRLTCEAHASGHEDEVELELKDWSSWLARLASQGFVLDMDARPQEGYILDTDTNRGLLERAMTGVFPSAVLVSSTNRRDCKGLLKLHTVEFSVPALSDAMNFGGQPPR